MNAPLLFGLKATGLVLLATTSVDAQTLSYVDQNAAVQMQTRSTASTDPRDALDVAGSGARIRVANGAYTPDRGTGGRTATFQPVDGATLEGSVCDKGNDTCATAVVIDSLPYKNVGNTEGCTNDYDEVCPFSGSTAPDVVYSYTPTEDILVDIELCKDGGATNYDTKLYVYEDACPGTLIACNDDACWNYNIPFVSELEQVPMLAGHTYYIVVDGYGSNAGDYDLQVDLAGPSVDCYPWKIPEGEPLCGQDYEDTHNGGCDSTVPVFQQITCFDPICGESGVYDYFGSPRRDGDWYEVKMGMPEPIRWTVEAEFDVQAFIIDPGSGDCTDYTILDSATAGPCEPVTLRYPEDLCAPWDVETYWLWVGPSSLDPLPCGATYNADMGGCVGYVPRGACCVDGGCAVTFESCCNEAGGAYRGDALPCGGPDCNGNGVGDWCDIVNGTSDDCQRDGTPDDCQLTGNDCNGNGIPDDCEVMAQPDTPLTCNADKSVVPGSVACESGGISSDNQFARCFANVAATTVLGMEFGVEVAEDSFLNPNIVTCTVYATNAGCGGAIPDGSLTPLGSATVDLGIDGSANGTIQQVAFPGGIAVPTGTDLVAEISYGDDTRLWPGSNSNGQTCASYIAADGCGLGNLTDLAAIGFPNMHLILNLRRQGGDAPNDCNGNGVPDECDCGDGVVDACAGEVCDTGQRTGSGECCTSGLGGAAGGCQWEPMGTPCDTGDPSGPCDTKDACDGAGRCDNQFQPSGTPCGDPSDSDCDSPDSCDGAGVCQANLEPDGAACADDGDRCTDDFCTDEICIHLRWPDEHDNACGACCYAAAGLCYDDQLEEECLGDVWAVNEFCASRTVDCEKVVVPTVSEWGLVVLSLLLSIGIATKFARRRALDLGPGSC